MKIRVWNAFASNNSGSYTLVGAFRESAVAESVARELADVCAAHSVWFESAAGEDAAQGSPLQAFILEHGLRLESYQAADDDWPQYGPPPSVAAIGTRVLVHVRETVTMPPTLGELIYARGGRVEVEIEHAHDPIIAEIGIKWRHGTKAELVNQESAAVRAEIESDPLVNAALKHARGVGNELPHVPSLRFRPSRDWMDPHVLVGALFGDLVGGVRAIAAIAERHGAYHELRVFEALDRGDPLGYLKSPSVH